MGKSAKNLKARSTYKAAASKLRKKQSGIGVNTKKGSAAHRKQVGGAKSGLTRVTNKLTKKRTAAGAGLKKNFANQAKASRAKKFSSKATKGRAAKKEWKGAKGADRKSRSTTDSAQKRVIKKQTGKKAYSQGFRETPAKTKAPRAGSQTKSQKLRAKIDSKKFANKELRGSEFKGAKKKPAYKKPKAGETAKQYKARLKRSGTNSTKRALSGNFGTRKEYYSVPGRKSGGKKTRKSVNRAKNRDFYSEGSNKRSKAITKSKQRQREKVKKQKAWEKKNKGRKS